VGTDTGQIPDEVQMDAELHLGIQDYQLDRALTDKPAPAS
jgi:hypothetical protein